MFDKTYMERFWPQLEAWLAFMQASARGLVSTPEDRLRCTIQCLQDTPVWYSNALKDRWLHCGAERAYRVLSEPWVLVTNQSDKEVQLYKISHLDFMVRRHVNKKSQTLSPLPTAPSIEGSPALTTSGSGGATLAQKVARIKDALEIDSSLPMPRAIAKANELMDMKPEGGLPAQAERLLAALGT